MRKTSTWAWCDAELPGCQGRKRQYFEPQNPVGVYTVGELGLNLALTQNSVWSLCMASSTYRCRSSFRGHLSLSKQRVGQWQLCPGTWVVEMGAGGRLEASLRTGPLLRQTCTGAASVRGRGDPVQSDGSETALGAYKYLIEKLFHSKSVTFR